MTERNIVIVTARCEFQSSLFGIRMQRFKSGIWIATWAFPLQSRVAEREGYARTTITGNFIFPEDYPGCPYCLRRSVWVCDCGRPVCWDQVTLDVRCPWCGTAARLGGQASSLQAGGDR